MISSGHDGPPATTFSSLGEPENDVHAVAGERRRNPRSGELPSSYRDHPEAEGTEHEEEGLLQRKGGGARQAAGTGARQPLSATLSRLSLSREPDYRGWLKDANVFLQPVAPPPASRADMGKCCAIFCIVFAFVGTVALIIISHLISTHYPNLHLLPPPMPSPPPGAPAPIPGMLYQQQLEQQQQQAQAMREKSAYATLVAAALWGISGCIAAVYLIVRRYFRDSRHYPAAYYYSKAAFDLDFKGRRRKGGSAGGKGEEEDEAQKGPNYFSSAFPSADNPSSTSTSTSSLESSLKDGSRPLRRGANAHVPLANRGSSSRSSSRASASTPMPGSLTSALSREPSSSASGPLLSSSASTPSRDASAGQLPQTAALGIGTLGLLGTGSSTSTSTSRSGSRGRRADAVGKME